MGGEPPDPELVLPAPVRLRGGGVTLSVRALTPANDARRARSRGDGGLARPLRAILLHGGPGLDHHFLLPLGVQLAARHEVWLPDLPGHGESALPARTGGEPLSLRATEERLGRWLASVVESGIRDGLDTVLIGHSLGAWLVREILRGELPRVAAAVLISPPAAGERRASTALRRAGTMIRRAGQASGRHAARARRDVRDHVEAETGGRASARFTAALDRARIRDPRLYGALTSELHRRLVAPPKPFDPRCPVLVLCGERDRTTPPEQARRVAAALRGARLELIPGAGHYPFADAPEATAAAIESFLAGLGISERGS